jgi:hypothetical protein
MQPTAIANWWVRPQGYDIILTNLIHRSVPLKPRMLSCKTMDSALEIEHVNGKRPRYFSSNVVFNCSSRTAFLALFFLTAFFQTSLRITYANSWTMDGLWSTIFRLKNRITYAT